MLKPSLIAEIEAELALMFAMSVEIASKSEVVMPEIAVMPDISEML